MIDTVIRAFFSAVTAIMMIFYTPTPVTKVNPPVIPDAEITQKITVMSYNVYVSGTGVKSPENRTPLVVENIKSASPDSFGLQEADEGWIERLSGSLSDEYAYVGIGRDSNSGGGEASPVFYKKDKFELVDSGTFWLSRTPEKASRGWAGMRCLKECAPMPSSRTDKQALPMLTSTLTLIISALSQGLNR